MSPINEPYKVVSFDLGGTLMEYKGMPIYVYKRPYKRFTVYQVGIRKTS